MGDVAALPATGSTTASAQVKAPATPGTYFYGVCVDTVAGETDSDNNCSAALPVTVSNAAEREGRPDLLVASPSVSDVSPAAGARFTLSVSVSNVGGTSSAPTTLRYYRSADAALTDADTQVGTDQVAELAGQGSASHSVDLIAPSTPGTYYFGACVDAFTDEWDTTNNCSASVTVTVPETEQSRATVEVSAEENKAWAPVGDKVDLSARVLDDGGEEVTGASVSWSSSDTSVATVDSLGVMTAVGEGTATLTATATLSGSSTQSVAHRLQASAGAVVKSAGTVVGSIEMEVVTRAARVEVAPISLSFDAVGESDTLSATVYDENGNVIQPRYLIWSSADTEVATVVWHSGDVQALGDGSTTVSVTANGSATGSAMVTVTLPKARVSASPRSLTFESREETQTVTITVLDNNGDEDEDAAFTWSSTYVSSPLQGHYGDITVTEVADGLSITAHGSGRGSITVSSGDVEPALIVISVWQIAASLEISPSPASVSVDGTVTLSAAVEDANGYSIPVAEGDRGGLAVTWATSASDVATVTGSSSSHNTGGTATVTGIKAGSATITASVVADDEDVTSTATITVTDSN